MSNSGNVIINFFLSNHFEVNVKELFFEKSSVHLFFFFYKKLGKKFQCEKNMIKNLNFVKQEKSTKQS